MRIQGGANAIQKEGRAHMLGLIAAATTAAMGLFVKGAIAGAAVYGGIQMVKEKMN